LLLREAADPAQLIGLKSAILRRAADIIFRVAPNKRYGGARTLQAGRALTGSLTELAAGVPFFATESPALVMFSTHSPLGHFRISDLPERAQGVFDKLECFPSRAAL
jgi:hypothetical protein